MSEAMAVRGSLQDLDLLSLLQMTCEEGGDAQITLQHGVDTASLYIQAGQIVHAEGQKHTGETVVYEVLTWKHGTFALARSVPPPALSIRRDWNSLLLEGLRRLDEQDQEVNDDRDAVAQKTVLAVSDNLAGLTHLRTALAPYEADLIFVTAQSQETAIALLAQHPDVVVMEWHTSPVLQGEFLAYVVGHQVLIPTIILVNSDEDTGLPPVSSLNPAVFLRTPAHTGEILAAIWGQVAREAIGESVGLPLFTLCEWIRLEKHTCLVRVSTTHDEGMLAFVDGVLLNAVVRQKLGAAAVKTIFGWDPITIEFGTVGAKVKSLIEQSLTTILSDTQDQSLERPSGPLALITPPLLPPERTLTPQAPESHENNDTSLNESHEEENPSFHPTIQAQPLPLTDMDPAAPGAEGRLPSLQAHADPSQASTAEVALADTEAMSLPADLIPIIGSATALTPHGDPTILVASTPLSGEDEMAGQTTESKIEKALSEIMTISGAIGAALVEVTSGMALGKIGNSGLDLDVAAAGNSEVLKSKMKVMKDLGIRGDIEDILITLQSQYHLLRPLGSDSTLFLYLVLNKDVANLALARRQLSKSEAGLIM